MTAQQPVPEIQAVADTEAFRPDDVDPQTHNANRCNLPVNACPECSRPKTTGDLMTAMADHDCDSCGRPMLLATQPGQCSVCAEGENLPDEPVVASCPAGCPKACCTGPPW